MKCGSKAFPNSPVLSVALHSICSLLMRVEASIFAQGLILTYVTLLIRAYPLPLINSFSFYRISSHRNRNLFQHASYKTFQFVNDSFTLFTYMCLLSQPIIEIASFIIANSEISFSGSSSLFITSSLCSVVAIKFSSRE